MRDFFRGKKIIITGHTGFKGAWLAQVLLDWGAKVAGISLPPHTAPNLFEILKLKKLTKSYFQDLRDFAEVKKIFKKEKPEIVFHLAAQAIVRQSYEEPLRTYSTNILGTANVLEALRGIPSVRSAVMITSDKVYENQ